tara:strand:- start:1909 stop:2157 length:249 start_codon:yes stop_codon:yes gene_type:complete
MHSVVKLLLGNVTASEHVLNASATGCLAHFVKRYPSVSPGQVIHAGVGYPLAVLAFVRLVWELEVVVNACHLALEVLFVDSV